MILTLKGTVQAIAPGHVVLECCGVGYGLTISQNTQTHIPQVHEQAFLYVSTQYSTDSVRLFGFFTEQERDAFLLLTHTSGVGPRLAIAILSALNPAQLYQAVHTKDKHLLTQIPGVGAKKADRLLVDLQGRVPMATTSHHPLLADLIAALNQLGFDPVQLRQVAQSVCEQHNTEQQNLSALLRIALRQITPQVTRNLNARNA